MRERERERVQLGVAAHGERKEQIERGEIKYRILSFFIFSELYVKNLYSKLYYCADV